MKNLLAFTLVAGVAITTATVAEAGGINRTPAKSEKSASRATPSAPSIGIAFDRGGLNRELTRLADILQPSVGDDSLLEEGGVGKKAANWSF